MLADLRLTIRLEAVDDSGEIDDKNSIPVLALIDETVVISCPDGYYDFADLTRLFVEINDLIEADVNVSR